MCFGIERRTLFVHMNWMLVALLLYHFISISSGLMKNMSIDGRDDKDTLILYQKLHNLIENITMRHSVNMRLWVLVLETRHPSTDDISHFHKTNNDKIMKIIHTQDYQLNITDRRDYATIFLAQTNDYRLENWLNMSLKMPPESIKIYVSHNDCHLNESMLAEIMSKLWHSHDKIGFIYYISLCMLPSHYNNSISGERSNIGVGSNDDYGQQSHRNNYIINLFYYHPFLRHKSVVEQHQHIWGTMEKINLINAKGWTDMSSEAFHYFPFVPHKLNFYGYLLTVILFPSTMAYFRSDINMFKKHLSKETLKHPLYSVNAYFGEDVEALLELQRLLNFKLKLSPTSDMGFYGFKVSERHTGRRKLFPHVI